MLISRLIYSIFQVDTLPPWFELKVQFLWKKSFILIFGGDYVSTIVI